MSKRPVPTDSLPRHDGGMMTEEQLDGLHCIYCDRGDGEMTPVYLGPRGEMFRHAGCRRELLDRRAERP